MNLQKLNPWNWFKHEDHTPDTHIPIKRSEVEKSQPHADGVSSFLRLHQEMDRLFNDVFQAFDSSSAPSSLPSRAAHELASYGVTQPSIDVSGDDQQYHIALDVPGLTQSDLSIEVEGDVLRIQGQKEEQSEAKDKHFYRMERRYGSFQRTLSLPEDANSDDMEASLKDGVLELKIPRSKTEKEDVKRISISS